MDLNYAPPLVRQALNSPNSALEPRQRNLVTLAKNGDSDAFAHLYDEYADRVYGYMYFNVANKQAAEDLTARVFSKAWNNIACYEPNEPPFSVWLYMIARDAVMEFNGARSDAAAIKEILSPADEGLGAFEQVESCDDLPASDLSASDLQ